MRLFEFDKIGSDPEFFIVNKETKAPISSIGIVEGEKKAPHVIGDGYAILKDNVLIEGNIPAVRTRDGFIGAMKELKSSMQHVLTDNMIVVSEDAMEFSKVDALHPEANVFGCASYENCWNEGHSQRISHIRSNFRCAGTHIHLSYNNVADGYTKGMLNNIIMKAFEICVTYPARQVYNNEFRAKYYGAMGCYRHTPYGLECRSLGGYWSKDEYLGWIYDNTMKAIEVAQNPDNAAYLYDLELEELLNNTDTVYKKLNLELETLKPE